jgi:hypothetical protein
LEKRLAKWKKETDWVKRDKIQLNTSILPNRLIRNNQKQTIFLAKTVDGIRFKEKMVFLI